MKGQQRKSMHEKIKSFQTPQEAEEERKRALEERERLRAEQRDSRLTTGSRGR